MDSETLPKVSLYLSESDGMTLWFRRGGERELEDGTAAPVRKSDKHASKGPYETWRARDPLHEALMTHLSRNAGNDPCSCLWLGVLDQALIDVFIGGIRSSETALFLDTAKHWLTTPAFAQVCRLAGLNPAWVRKQIDAYKRVRPVQGRSGKARSTARPLGKSDPA